MNVPTDLKYTESHEWVRADADGKLSIGITDHAQNALGDLVFIELPAVGRILAPREASAVVESVKAASDVYAPVAGVVAEVNDAIVTAPEKVNADPYGSWFYKIKPSHPGALGALLDAAAYSKLAGDE